MDHRGNGFAPMLKIGCSHPSWLTNDCRNEEWLTNDCRNEERKVKVISKLVTLGHCAMCIYIYHTWMEGVRNYTS